MQGRRVETIQEVYDGEAGVYCLVTNTDTNQKVLWIKDPNGNVGRISKHTIEEHDDGTITVSPSILATKADHGNDYHGFLERGIWRNA